MKSKFTIICASLIILLFSNFSAFPQSPDTSNYEKDYHRFVDSKEPLAELKNKDIQLYQSYSRPVLSHPLTPSQTIKYGPENLQALDIYTHQGRKSAPVIFFIHSGWEDKIEGQMCPPTPKKTSSLLKATAC